MRRRRYLGTARPGRRVWRVALWAGLVVALIFAIGGGVISADGLHDRIRPSDVGVVLGNKVERDGRPSRGLQARLDEAVTLYRQGEFKIVIVSGGPGDEGFDEATVMRAYMIKHGVPAAAVIADSHGVNTMATARNTAALMRARGWKTVLAVSQYYHMPRIRLAFRKCGVTAVSTAHAHLFELHDLFSVPREVVGYPVYFLR
jgi:vancomycin permeability regulator SanA